MTGSEGSISSAASLLPTSADVRSALVALTPHGPAPVAAGPDLTSLALLPPDRLALGPATVGGLVAIRLGGHGWRLVVTDSDGSISTLQTSHGEFRSVTPDVVDTDAVSFLWRLQDPRATRSTPAELLMRLLLWSWLDHPERPVEAGHGDPGVDCLTAGNLRGLATLQHLTLGTHLDATIVAELADTVGHPPLPLDELADGGDERCRLDVLNACLPTRWQLADELRVVDGRGDLAKAVMEAPTPHLDARVAD